MTLEEAERATTQLIKYGRRLVALNMALEKGFEGVLSESDRSLFLSVESEAQLVRNTMIDLTLALLNTGLLEVMHEAVVLERRAACV